jgi:capsule biosynthesis phosphatase
MNILIPLGGIGKRFGDFGYNKPKPLIKVLGKEIIFWLLESLKLESSDRVYIAYNEILDYYDFSEIVKSKFPFINLMAIPSTRGASETILLSLESFGIEGDLTILDGDTWYNEDILGKVRDCGCNAVTYFTSTDPNPIYSYIQIQENKIVKIKEKNKISDNANSGCYVFSDTVELRKTILEIGFHNEKELYTSQVIEKMIEKGFEFKPIKVEDFHVLGTPKQIIKFSKDFKIKPLRFCFDLDNTLVTHPTIPNDYKSVEPITETINYLRKLKKNGHRIIIYTARRMRTHQGNVGSVIADIGEITINTLKKFDIPYDELYFGKPYAHFYIDDLMVDPKTDLNKSLGFYMEEVIPRHFNEVEVGKTFIKKSFDTKLQGESHYYKWVQENTVESIKKLFPKLISSTDNMIELEYCDGINYSTLYVNEILSTKDLDTLLSNIEELHNYYESDTKHYEYYNFSDKFLNRMSIFNHEKLGITEEEIEKITKKLNSITDEGFNRVMIHGDAVFSNIISLPNNQIKFVDVRGVENNINTCFGHPLYDYAKIYQSLIGYDEILLDKKIKVSYKTNMIKHFESKFTEDELSKIKTITVSLLYSMIPLHLEFEKLEKYVKLGKRII